MNWHKKSSSDLPIPCSVANGLTMRDWFAGQAMNGFCADPTSHDLFDNVQDMARATYRVADAMLAARKEEE